MMSKDHKGTVVDLNFMAGLAPVSVYCQIADVVVGRRLGSYAACLTGWKLLPPVLLCCPTGPLSASQCSLRGLRSLS